MEDKSPKKEISESDSQLHEESASSGNNSRRPMNAFFLFCKRHRAIVKNKYPNLENRSISKILGDWWHKIGEEDKAVFTKLASDYKEAVMREQPNFRWRKPPAPNASSNTYFTKSQKSVPEPVVNGNSSMPPSNILPAAASFQVKTSPIEPSYEDNPYKKSYSGSHSSAPSSKSSSPEPSLVQSPSSEPAPPPASSAPKPIKKRYLAAEMAKQDGSISNSCPIPVSPRKTEFNNAESNSSPSPSSLNGSEYSTSMSPEAEKACEALLQLAKANDNDNNRSGSTSGTSSPPSRDSSQICFSTLKDAVWGTLAKDLKKQTEEREKLTRNQPLNLTNQWVIEGQTIIEHIIENLLDPSSGEEDNTDGKSVHLNNNQNVLKGKIDSDPLETAEKIKEAIYQGLKQDLLKREPGSKAISKSLWKTLPHNNISKPGSNAKAGNGTEKVPSLVENQDKKLEVETPKTTPASNEIDEAGRKPEDPSNLNIKNLLAQSPIHLSPRSKATSASTASITNAVIASVLQQQHTPVEQLFLQPREAVPPVSVTLINSDVPAKPLNLSTSLPRSPDIRSTTPDTSAQVTICPTPTSVAPNKRKLQMPDYEEEDDIRRSSRSCKGKRYQEFKDEGRLGKKSNSGRKSHKSGDSVDGSLTFDIDNSLNDAIKLPVSMSSMPLEKVDPANLSPYNTQQQQQLQNTKSFDVTAKLNAIPALSLDDYQEKLTKAKSSAATSSREPCVNGLPRRRKSGENPDLHVDYGKRKSRRGAAESLASTNVNKKVSGLSVSS